MGRMDVCNVYMCVCKVSVKVCVRFVLDGYMHEWVYVSCVKECVRVSCVLDGYVQECVCVSCVLDGCV